MSENKRIILFSHPRTRSHLIERILSAQANAEYLRHPFAWSRGAQMQLLCSGPYEETSQQLRDALRTQWQDGMNEAAHFCKQTNANGKIAWIHTHPHFTAPPPMTSEVVYNAADAAQLGGFSDPFWTLRNAEIDADEKGTAPQAIPDSFLSSITTPIFLIRHPVYAVPSNVRACLEVESLAPVTPETMAFNNTLAFSRGLYDWYESKYPGRATVIDSDDVIRDFVLLQKLCKRCGFESSQLIYEWKATTKEEYDQTPEFIQKIKRRILASTGVEKEGTGAPPDQIDWPAERSKWKQEFGDARGAKVEEVVNHTMGDYSYLYAKRMT